MDAISFTGATCSLTSLYQRVNRYRKRKAEEELADMASYEIERGGTGFGGIIAGIHRNRAEDAGGAIRSF
jgi:hypothetical protein